MSFLGRLFGSSKAGEKLVDGAISAVDKMFHTDQERAEEAAQARREGFQVYMEWLKSTSGSRVARRLIALIVVSIWAVEHIASVTLQVVGMWVEDPQLALRIIDSAKILGEQAANNNAIVGVVLLFYFGGPAAIEAAKGLVARWTGAKL